MIITKSSYIGHGLTNADLLFKYFKTKLNKLKQIIFTRVNVT